VFDKVFVEVKVTVDVVVGGRREPCWHTGQKQGNPPPGRGFIDPTEDG
jgi:hypothetical protein